MAGGGFRHDVLVSAKTTLAAVGDLLAVREPPLRVRDCSRRSNVMGSHQM
jgi:hypothetical protein